MLATGGKPSIELPSGEDFFNQHEHDNPEGFFDSLPDHPTPPADYTPNQSSGGMDPQRRTSSMGGAAANGIAGEPSTPLGLDPNHIPEGAERVGGGQPAVLWVMAGSYRGIGVGGWWCSRAGAFVLLAMVWVAGSDSKV